MKRSFPLFLLFALGALGAATYLPACSGADGDPAPTVPEGGVDSGVIVIVDCVDGAAQ